jgi:hypothetical protein
MDEKQLEERMKKGQERHMKVCQLSEEDQVKFDDRLALLRDVGVEFVGKAMERADELVERRVTLGDASLVIIQRIAANHVTNDVLTPHEMKLLKRVRGWVKADRQMDGAIRMYIRLSKRFNATAEPAIDGLIDSMLPIPEPEPVPAMTSEVIGMGGMFPDEPEGGDQR